MPLNSLFVPLRNYSLTPSFPFPLFLPAVKRYPNPAGYLGHGSLVPSLQNLSAGSR